MQGCRTPGSLTLSDKAWGINTVNHKCMHIHLIPMGLCDIEYVSRGRRGIGFSKKEGQNNKGQICPLLAREQIKSWATTDLGRQLLFLLITKLRCYFAFQGSKLCLTSCVRA